MRDSPRRTSVSIPRPQTIPRFFSAWDSHDHCLLVPSETLRNPSRHYERISKDFILTPPGAMDSLRLRANRKTNFSLSGPTPFVNQETGDNCPKLRISVIHLENATRQVV